MAVSIPTPPTHIQELLMAGIKTKTLYTAVKLRIPDNVHELEPNADLESISSKLELPPSTLHRLLNACVTLGLLDISTSNEKDVYTTTHMTKEWLLSSSKRSVTGLVNYSSYVDQKNPCEMSYFVELGENRTQCRPDLFHEISDNPEAAEMFAEGMGSICQTAISAIGSFDLSNYKTVLDVGGGVGVFAGDLKKTYTDMIVNILELPVTILQAKTYWAKRGGQPDFNFIEGDMFKGPLPEADLYILGHVLHDFSDEACHHVLSNIAKSAKPGDALLILEKVLPDPPTLGTCGAHMLDMAMMCVPLFAKERTFKEYRYLGEKAGFGDVQYKENVHDHYFDAILAIRK